MNAILDQFAAMSLPEASAWALLENVVLFALSLAIGHLLVWKFANRPVVPTPSPVSQHEIALAASCVLLNTVVTIAGWWLWQKGVIVIRRDTGAFAWLDVLILLLVMDFAMYVFHRVAHLPPIYRLVHTTHHRYDHPRPLDLFVLSPPEVLGFGGLWLFVICVYHASWLGMSVYLALNLAFGTFGHLGVEPFPRRWMQWPLLRAIGSSTFHAGHHLEGNRNFGFYTIFWDRLFGTLDPGYETRFGQEEQA